MTVTFPDGTTATGTADQDGNYVIDIPANEDLKGGETLPVTSTDKAGKTLNLRQQWGQRQQDHQALQGNEHLVKHPADANANRSY